MEEEITRTYDIDKKPRTLKAEEIECRVGTINGRGCSLLLYKDARVDMKILDETYGVGNWQRTHEVINDNLFCTIEIWNDRIKQWVKKQDVGTESYTEKEKGEASDSFKRAGFNVGIGRELYTSPFIWVSNKDCKIIGSSGKFKCFDKFEVAKILIDENKTITALAIKNTTSNKIVFVKKPTEGAK